VFSSYLARNTPHLELLAPCELDDGDGLLLVAGNLDVGLGRVQPQVSRRDHSPPFVALDVERERDRALGAKVGRAAVALLRVRKLVNVGRAQRQHAQAVRQELVVQHRRVELNLDQVNRQRRRLRDNHAAQRIGQANVGVGVDHLYPVCADLCDIDVDRRHFHWAEKRPG